MIKKIALLASLILTPYFSWGAFPITPAVMLSTASTTFVGFGRNRILNGDMRIDQNREGTAYSTAVGGSLSGGGQAFYALDQWRFESTVSSTFTVLRTNESLPPGGMFSQAMRISVISSSTLSAADAANMEYPMDPIYQQDWGWGTSSAKPITLQFRVLSSSAGVFSIAFLNGVNSRSYVSSYTVTTANTWEQKTITIPGDTAGNTSVWPTSGTVFGLKVVWDMGSGSNVKTATLNQWQAGSVWRASNADDFRQSLASVYFTGVQLELGSYPSAFEYMPYDDMLRRLQKYYYKTFPQGTVVGQNKGLPGSLAYISVLAATGAYGLPVRFVVDMLAAPTITYFNPSASNAKWRNVSAAADSAAASDAGVAAASTGFMIYNPQVAGDGVGAYMAVHLTANSRLGGS